MDQNCIQFFIIFIILSALTIQAGTNLTQFSDVCIECLSRVGIFITKQDQESLFDINNDGIIGCEDVIRQRQTKTNMFRDHVKDEIFAQCSRENDVAFIDDNKETIQGDIQSMIVVFNTIFALTSKAIYKFDKETLMKLQSADHNLGKDAFLYISPYVIESHEVMDPVIRVCSKSTSPLRCIRYSGQTYRNIELNDVSNATFETEKRDIESILKDGVDKKLRNPIFKEFSGIRLNFIKFLLSQDTKDIIKNSVEPFLPYSLLIIGSGSNLPRKLNIIHPLHSNRISINCSQFNESINYDSYRTLNYNLNPSTKTLSIFLRNDKERKVYVSSAHISDIDEAFKSGLYENVSRKICNFEQIPGIRNATSGIRLNSNMFVISNNREMPTIIERGKQKIKVYWNPFVYIGSDYNRLVFIASNEDQSEVYGYSGDKILKLMRRMSMSSESNSLLIAISIPVISLLVLSTIVLVITLRKLKSNKKLNLLTNESEFPQTNGTNRIAVCPIPTRPCPLQRRPPVPLRHILTTKVPYYDSSSIVITGNLSEGHFGEVKRGWLRTDVQRIDVAIKTLKQPDCEVLHKEANIIVMLDHPNILKLVGIMTDSQQPIALLFPFMANGDLYAYVVNHKDIISLNQLFNFSMDIGAGMKYLAWKQIVHRDLAARNCFVDENLNVKVGDFGLSRMIEAEFGVHRLGQNSLVPVHHPSDVIYGFNEKTDVWSFGRLLFEIFSFGTCSMGDLHMIPDVVVKLMTACQDKQQKNRPTFSDIVRILKDIDVNELPTRKSTSPTIRGYITITR